MDTNDASKSKTGPIVILTENYFLIVSITIAALVAIIIYFCSKHFRIGRTVDRMNIYQSYQELTSFPYSKYGNMSLVQCRVASAYNAAHGGYQIFDYTSEEVVLACLKSGARYLEFNIFNSEFGDTAIPVVSMGYTRGEWKLTLNDTPLENIFHIISKNAFSLDAGVSNYEDPIFIGMVLNTNGNTKCLDLIATLITDYFRKRLLDNKFSYQSSDDIAKIKMAELAGKVVFFSSAGYQGSRLEEYVNYSWDNLSKSPNHVLQRIKFSDLENGTINLKALDKENGHKLTIVIPGEEGTFWSNNFDPTRALETGCHFVAMNYQNIDEGMDKYITLFKRKSIIVKDKEFDEDI